MRRVGKKLGLGLANIFLLLIVLVCTLIIYDTLFNSFDWRTAKRDSAGLAPSVEEKEAVVLVYAARTYNWRRHVAVHSWIAIKEKDAKSYVTYQVAGFYLRSRGTSILLQKDIPDRYWYGEAPVLVQELIGEEAEKAIPVIKKAVKEYPYGHIYKAWPGPNSNTFISYIIRQVPELTVELPPNALGKDFLGYTTFFARSESGSGWQFSILGVFGITIGKAEGIELNIMGMDLGIDFLNPALKLPFFGRIGMKDKPL